jgi:hypothetical protein
MLASKRDNPTHVSEAADDRWRKQIPSREIAQKAYAPEPLHGQLKALIPPGCFVQALSPLWGWNCSIARLPHARNSAGVERHGW